MNEHFLFTTFMLIVIITAITNRDCDPRQPLGLSNNLIKNWQFSASSYLKTQPKCQPYQARLSNGRSTSWCARDARANEWIQIDFGVSTKVRLVPLFVDSFNGNLRFMEL
ncbi:hypothetical protein ACOME3_010235 [Neoechinorhynchus agilis]